MWHFSTGRREQRYWKGSRRVDHNCILYSILRQSQATSMWIFGDIKFLKQSLTFDLVEVLNKELRRVTQRMRHDVERTKLRVEQSWLEDFTKRPQTVGSLIATITLLTCQLTQHSSSFSPQQSDIFMQEPNLSMFFLKLLVLNKISVTTLAQWPYRY